jgi:hypothetical protein
MFLKEQLSNSKCVSSPCAWFTKSIFCLPLTSDHQNVIIARRLSSWHGGISCDWHHQTFRSIYVSFNHIDASCFHFASVTWLRRIFCRTFHEGLSALLMQWLADRLADFQNQQSLLEESPALCCFCLPCLAIRQCWIADNSMFVFLSLHIWTLLFLKWLWDNFVCMCCICGRTTTKWMLAYLKALVAYLKAYVFSKYSDW